MVSRKPTRKARRKSCKTIQGSGILDRIIDKLPFEVHLPSYQYCGPGTKLDKRLSRGDPGINKLDTFCKEHDIFYATNKDSSKRYKADKKLGSEAFSRVFSKDAKLGERAASLLVSAAMGVKTGLTKLGRGISSVDCRKKNRKNRKTKKNKKPSKEIVFTSLVKDVRKDIRKSKAKTLDAQINTALKSAKRTVIGKKIRIPRILRVPSFTGGVLPLIPILAGLSAIGAIAGSAAGVVKTAKDIKVAQKHLEETERHNRAMELKVGNGLWLRPNVRGGGLYLTSQKSAVSKNGR